jgi:hypothetical protein
MLISWLTPELRVIVSSAGAVAARDASLANASDNPAAPKAGTALLRRFLFEACFTAFELPRRLKVTRLQVESGCDAQAVEIGGQPCIGAPDQAQKDASGTASRHSSCWNEQDAW